MYSKLGTFEPKNPSLFWVTIPNHLNVLPRSWPCWPFRDRYWQFIFSAMMKREYLTSTWNMYGKRGCQIPHRCWLKISQTLPLAGMLHFNVLQIMHHAVWRFSLLPIKGLWWIMLLPSHNFLGSLADNIYLIEISTLATRHNFSQFPTSTKCFRCSSPSAC